MLRDIGNSNRKGRKMKSDFLTRILLNCLVFSLIAVAGCNIQIGYSHPSFLLAKYERTVQLSKPMAAGSLFSAKSNDGWITVTGGDITECNVTATIIARADSDTNARRIADQTKLRLEQFGNKLTLKVQRPILMFNQSVDVQIDAKVLKNCDLELGTDDGDITIENVKGRVDVKTDDGKVSLSQVGGDIKVRSDDGSIKVKEVTGDVNLRSDDGRITVVYSKDADGVCNISLVTDDGAIDFTAPTNFSADVEILTDDGSINTGLPIKVMGKLGRIGIKGTIGTGQGRLYIRTDDGSIRIR